MAAGLLLSIIHLLITCVEKVVEAIQRLFDPGQLAGTMVQEAIRKKKTKPYTILIMFDDVNLNQ